MLSLRAFGFSATGLASLHLGLTLSQCLLLRAGRSSLIRLPRLPDTRRCFVSVDASHETSLGPKKREWAEEEKELISQSLREGRSLKEIHRAVLPHRTYNGIVKVARALPEGQWTAADTEKLATLLRTKRTTTIEDIQKEHFPGFSFISIQTRLRRLRAQNAVEIPRRGGSTFKLLTDADQQAILRLYAQGSNAAEIAVAIKRPYANVLYVLRQRNLPLTAVRGQNLKSRAWTKEEDAILESILSSDVTGVPADVQEQFPARSEQAIRTRMYRLRKWRGISRRTAHSTWTPEELRVLDVLAPPEEERPDVPEIARILKRTVCSIYYKLFDRTRLHQQRARDSTSPGDTNSRKAEDGAGHSATTAQSQGSRAAVDKSRNPLKSSGVINSAIKSLGRSRSRSFSHGCSQSGLLEPHHQVRLSDAHRTYVTLNTPLVSIPERKIRPWSKANYRSFASLDTPSTAAFNAKNQWWTKEEKELLLKLRGEGKSVKEICEVLPHRSYQSIVYMANTGLRSSRRVWRPADTERLKSLLETGEFIERIQENHFPDFSVDAVSARIRKLRKEGDDNNSMPIRHAIKRFTESEKQTLRTLHAQGLTI